MRMKNGVSVRKAYAVLAAVLLVCSTIILAYSGVAADNSVDFIVYSDTHIGRGATIKSGSDNLSSLERYAMLLGSTNQYSATVMINNGDLTDGWYLNNSKQTLMYQDYLRLTKLGHNPTVSIKGNHDCNVSMFIELFHRTTEVTVKNDVLAIMLGSKNQDCQEWMTQGTTYQQYQIDVLNRTICSTTWNNTKYHFLFMHYTPDSTWPNSTAFHLPDAMKPYYQYFTLVFCGHEGGPAQVSTQQGATVIHAAHLADGKLATDTYLTVKIDRTTNTVNVRTVNFVTAQTTLLFPFS